MPTSVSAIAYEHALTSAGVAPGQAAVHANALAQVRGEVAACKDLKRADSTLQHRIVQSEQRVRTGLHAKIDRVHVELDTRINRVHVELDAKIDRVHVQLDAKIDRVHAELNAKIDHFYTELDADIDRVRDDLQARISQLAVRVSAVERELVLHRWLFGLLFAMQATTLGLVLKLALDGSPVVR